MQKRYSRIVMVGMVLTLMVMALTSPTVQAVSPGLSTPYSQNFDTLSASGTGNAWANDSTLAGWYSTRTTYNAGNGSTNTGALYSFGTGTNPERALGSVASGGTGTILYAISLTNDTGATISQINVSYKGEQWRDGGNATPVFQKLNFAYQINASAVNAGTWNAVTALDYTSPIATTTAGALDGNSNAITISGAVTLSLAAGDTVWLRWEDINDANNDHGLAIDDVSISAGVASTSTPTNTPGDETPTPTPTSTSTPVPCVTAPDHIYELQENGSKFNPTTSPSASRTVIGIVTGDYQLASPNGLDGYYVQDETGDANTATSDGIFVYDPAPFLLDVVPGQRIQLTGTTLEFSDQTEFVPSAVTDCGGTGSIAPVSVTLPVISLSNLENYEGMLVAVSAADTNPLTVTETFNLGRFGEIQVSSGGRTFTPTNYVEPGAPAIAETASNILRRLLIDDGRNGTPVDSQVPYIPSTNTQFREGFTTPSITGVLGYGFSVYRLQPTTAINWTAANPRGLAPAVGGTLRVASFNVLNFFNGNGAGGGFPTSRGANTQAELNRQKAKTIPAIIGLNADVIAINEMENDNTATEYGAIEELVDGLNAVVGAGTFAFIDTGIVGGDEIRVALLYKPANVTPVGTFAKLDNVAPFNVNTRPPVAQLFQQNSNGEQFYIVANHFKSKSCSGSTGSETDQGDGQSCWNPTRILAANNLMTWINNDAYFDNDPDVLIIGDLNSYALEDPIDALKGGGYSSLIETFVGLGNVAYSFTFSGESGYLDHALANASLLSQVVNAGEWHINSDEPFARDYNDDILDSGENATDLRQPYLYEANPYRSSDHDPVVVGLNLNSGVATDTPTVTETPADATATITPSATPSVEATFTSTPTPSETPGEGTPTNTPDAPTLTPTATIDAGTELLVNGGFEAKTGNGKPDLTPWTLKNAVGDKIKCDVTIAFEGTCAFLFKGG
ncbi:MAG TPA: ExeM/NucH family extracellular endonuclease, partial [Phototrophicaceae bacterium]|nr:ExeM/NucH family extracellular endonuclease [Phototrophicaceae bacterium]